MVTEPDMLETATFERLISELEKRLNELTPDVSKEAAEAYFTIINLLTHEHSWRTEWKVDTVKNRIVIRNSSADAMVVKCRCPEFDRKIVKEYLDEWMRLHSDIQVFKLVLLSGTTMIRRKGKSAWVLIGPINISHERLCIESRLKRRGVKLGVK